MPASFSSAQGSFGDDDPDLVFELGADGAGEANPSHLAILNSELARVLAAERSIEARKSVMDSGEENRYESRFGDTLFRISVSLVGSDDTGCRFKYSVRSRTGNTAIPVDARIIEDIPLPVTVTNGHGTILHANKAARAFIGVHSTDDIVGEKIWSFVHPSDLETAQESGRMVRQGHTASFERHRLVRRDGRTIPVEISTSEIRWKGERAFAVASHDLSGLQALERALEESQQLFSAIFYTAPFAISVSRNDTGAIVDVNPIFLAYLGKDRDEVVGSSFQDLGVEYDRDAVESLRGSLEDEDVSSRVIETRLTDAQGVQRTLLCSAAGILVNGESCMALMAVDVTERKEGEQRLREAKERAEEMTILKSAFLTNMTHEIRTPLTVILGFTSILRQGIRKEYGRFVTLIERSGRRLLLMLDSILDLAQLEAGTLEPEIERHSIDEIVHGVLGTISPIAEDKGLSLTLQPSPEGLYIETDHAVLSRILNNLIDNAVKFTEKGEVRIVVRGDGEDALVTIEDTGIGIHEDFLPRIFDAFAQESTGLARTHQGSGLGLTVSRQLIELLGGSLAVESEKGVGSRIIIRLPTRYPAKNAD